MGWRIQGPIVALLIVAGTGCATAPSKPMEPAGNPLAEPVTYPFRPAQWVSPVTMTSGRYPNLFAPSSYGVLVTSDVLQMKAEEAARAGSAQAAALPAGTSYDPHFWVIELRLESAFPDTSIAYDVVGLRNMNVALVMPNGERLAPLQRIPGSSASEELEGALRRFGRTNLLIFPKRDLLSGEAWLGPNAPALELRIEGFNSQFALAWPALPPETPDAPVAVPAPDRATLLRNSLAEFYDDIRTMMRMAQ